MVQNDHIGLVPPRVFHHFAIYIGEEALRIRRRKYIYIYAHAYSRVLYIYTSIFLNELAKYSFSLENHTFYFDALIFLHSPIKK